MNSNNFTLYNSVTEVYEKLLGFCAANGLRVKETKDKYFSITAKKHFILFWRNLHMDVRILAVDKKKVEVNVMVYKLGKRQAALENDYRVAMENFLSNSQ